MNTLHTDPDTEYRGTVDTPPPLSSPLRTNDRHTTAATPARGAAKYIVVAVLILAVGGGGFAAGYGVAKGSATTASTNGFGGRNGGAGFGQRRGGFGTVTAVSDSSITIQQMSFGNSSNTSGAAKTYTITSSTTVTDGSSGSSASVSDIKTGDEVRITTASTTSTDATAIEINPVMGNSGAPGAQTQDDSTGSTDTSTDTSTSTT